jgi:hypothetical protein
MTGGVSLCHSSFYRGSSTFDIMPHHGEGHIVFLHTCLTYIANCGWSRPFFLSSLAVMKRWANLMMTSLPLPWRVLLLRQPSDCVSFGKRSSFLPFLVEHAPNEYHGVSKKSIGKHSPSQSIASASDVSNDHCLSAHPSGCGTSLGRTSTARLATHVSTARRAPHFVHRCYLTLLIRSSSQCEWETLPHPSDNVDHEAEAALIGWGSSSHKRARSVAQKWSGWRHWLRAKDVLVLQRILRVLYHLQESI